MSNTAPDWSSLLAALLDFERSPGRYAVRLREPRPLFEHTLAVLQLAAGRTVAGLAGRALDAAQEEELRGAARFFVRTVLLRPGVDHYTLLGLARGCEADELREHYRLMIRLTHPDFAAGRGEAWPADAATRINQANDVLASFERRSDYNATLAPAQPAAAAAPKLPEAARAVVLTRRPKKAADAAGRTGPRVPRGVKIALASLGALAAATALLLHGPAGDSGSLAVRKPPAVAQPTLPELPTLPTEALAPPVMDPVHTELVEVLAQHKPANPGRTEPRTPDRTAPHLPVRTEPVEVLAQHKPVATPPKPRRSQASSEPADAWMLGHGADSDLAALRLAMDTHIGLPKAMPVVAAAEPAAAAPAPANAREQRPAPTLAQVQPALSNLMGSLPGARGENMAHWIDADFRAHPDTGRFVRHFNQLLADQRVARLGEVRFSARAQGEQLVVDGVIQLHLLDTNEQARLRDLHLRAFFQPHDGRTVLTQLVAGPLQ